MARAHPANVECSISSGDTTCKFAGRSVSKSDPAAIATSIILSPWNRGSPSGPNRKSANSSTLRLDIGTDGVADCNALKEKMDMAQR